MYANSLGWASLGAAIAGFVYFVHHFGRGVVPTATYVLPSFDLSNSQLASPDKPADDTKAQRSYFSENAFSGQGAELHLGDVDGDLFLEELEAQSLPFLPDESTTDVAEARQLQQRPNYVTSACPLNMIYPFSICSGGEEPVICDLLLISASPSVATQYARMRSERVCVLEHSADDLSTTLLYVTQMVEQFQIQGSPEFSVSPPWIVVVGRQIESLNPKVSFVDLLRETDVGLTRLSIEQLACGAQTIEQMCDKPFEPIRKRKGAVYPAAPFLIMQRGLPAQTFMMLHPGAQAQVTIESAAREGGSLTDGLMKVLNLPEDTLWAQQADLVEPDEDPTMARRHTTFRPFSMGGFPEPDPQTQRALRRLEQRGELGRLAVLLTVNRYVRTVCTSDRQSRFASVKC